MCTVCKNCRLRTNKCFCQSDVLNNNNNKKKKKKKKKKEEEEEEEEDEEKELNDLYCSPNIVRVIKSRRLRWAGHAARMGGVV